MRQLSVIILIVSFFIKKKRTTTAKQITSILLDPTNQSQEQKALIFNLFVVALF